MTEWKVRRFWESAKAVVSEDGVMVHLDGRPVRTPTNAPMAFPTLAMAEAAASEWNAQGKEIDPNSMPVTRSANSAVDRVAGRATEVADMLAAFAETDLTCYRAAGPKDLVVRQNAAWDPLLNWVQARFGVRLVPVEGVIHRPQPVRTVERMRVQLDVMTPFELVAMHDLVSLSGSLVIGLAVSDGHWSPEAMWTCSRIDEDWQAERWGVDIGAATEALHKRSAFLDAARFLDLARG